MSSGYRSFLVLGTGVGKAIAYTLAKDPQTNLIFIGDIDRERAEHTAEYVKKISNNKDIQCVGIQFLAEDTEKDLFVDFDVVISALPARYNPLLAERALKNGVDFCDLGGVVDVTKEMLKQQDQAVRAGISIVPDCGVMPGLGMVLARALMSDMESTDEIKIYVGGLPQKPRPPVFYQKIFSMEGLKHICMDPVPVLENGEIKMLPPFSLHEWLHCPELESFSEDFGGLIEAFATAGASVSPWALQKLGVRNFVEKTVRWPGFVDFVKPLPIKYFEEILEPHINIPVDADNPDLIWASIQLRSCHKDGRSLQREAKLVDYYDPITGLTAMERTTGITTALVAILIAEGKTKPGVYTMDEAMDGRTRTNFLETLKKHFKITFTEKIA